MDPESNQSSGSGVPPSSAVSDTSLNDGFDGSANGAQSSAAIEPSMSQAQVGAIQNQSSPVGQNLSSDDNSDVLDHEWVRKAKDIVEKTKSDPFLESKELGKIRSDYLKIRYNKETEDNTR